MDEKKIARINELYHKKELTPEEKIEQANLRSEYLAAIRASLKADLEQIDVVKEDGTVVPLTSLKRKRK